MVDEETLTMAQTSVHPIIVQTSITTTKIRESGANGNNDRALSSTKYIFGSPYSISNFDVGITTDAVFQFLVSNFDERITIRQSGIKWRKRDAVMSMLL